MCQLHRVVFLAWAFLRYFASGLDVPVCCPDGQGVSHENSGDTLECIDSPWLETFEPLKNLSTYQHNFTCPNMTVYHVIEYGSGGFSAAKIEKLSMMIVEPDYCFDFAVTHFSIRTCSSESDSESDMQRVTVNKRQTVNWTISVCCGASVILLLATAYIYSANKDLKCNPHSPYIVSHNIALALAYVCRIARQFIEINEDSAACEFVGFASQMFTLAAFFWMNSMCIDVYLSLWSMRPSADRKRYSLGKKFMVLSSYAWGVPLVITMLTLLVEHLDAVPQASTFKPNFGAGSSCLFSGDAKWIYFRIPLLLTVAVNFTLFTLTALKLIEHQKTVACLSPKSRVSSEKKYFALYFKLFIIMGLCWGISMAFDACVKIILPILGRDALPKSMRFLFTIADLVFSFQGVFVFILFVCNKKTSGILKRVSRSVSCLSSRTVETTSNDDKTPYTVKTSSVTPF